MKPGSMLAVSLSVKRMLSETVAWTVLEVTMAEFSDNFDLAVAAYREGCDLNNLIFQDPDQDLSRQVDNVIYLRVNPSGYVARYDIRRRRLLV